MSTAAAVVALVGAGFLLANRETHQTISNVRPIDTEVSSVGPSAGRDTIVAAATTIGWVHPVVDLPGCTRTWARTSAYEGVISNPFTRRSSKPIAYQVIGDPSGSLLKPFAMVERFFADQQMSGGSPADFEINGMPARIEYPDGGNGMIWWALPDGSDAYLRTSSVPHDELIQLAEALVSRPTDASVPGFDLTADAPLDMKVLDENFGPFPSGHIVSSGCDLNATGTSVRAIALDTRPLVNAVYILDRPSRPFLAMRQLDDGEMLLVTAGFEDDTIADDAIASVREATADEWNSMLYYPTHWELLQPGFPVDQELADALAGRTFVTPEQVRDAVLPLLQQRAAGGSDQTISAVNNSPYYEWVFTLPVTDRPFIAQVWSVTYDVDGQGGLVAFEAHLGIRCADGSAHPPDDTGCGEVTSGG